MSSNWIGDTASQGKKDNDPAQIPQADSPGSGRSLASQSGNAGQYTPYTTLPCPAGFLSPLGCVCGRLFLEPIEVRAIQGVVGLEFERAFERRDGAFSIAHEPGHV